MVLLFWALVSAQRVRTSPESVSQTGKHARAPLTSTLWNPSHRGPTSRLLSGYYSEDDSHFLPMSSLGAWLKENNVPLFMAWIPECSPKKRVLCLEEFSLEAQMRQHIPPRPTQCYHPEHYLPLPGTKIKSKCRSTTLTKTVSSPPPTVSQTLQSDLSASFSSTVEMCSSRLGYRCWYEVQPNLLCEHLQDQG